MWYNKGFLKKNVCWKGRSFVVMFLPCLLPDVEGLQLEQLEFDTSQICLTVAATASTASCPVCEMPSHRVQSRYTRIIADLPWTGVAVHLRLLGFALGGEAGARQLTKLGMSASPTTILR
jgi:transposase